jgi:glycosyltransferase involved in cell wall biosynthesis
MSDVVVNGRFLGRAVTGVERYAGEITRRLDGRIRVCRPPDGATGARGHLWEQMRLPGLVGEGLLWSPANTGPMVVSRQVVTVHDMAPLDHPEWFEPRVGAWYRWLLPKLVQRVTRVITVSQFSKTRLMERLGLPADWVVAIPNGVSRWFHPRPPAEVTQVTARYRLRAPYLLMVGSLEPRKNFDVVARAWDEAGPLFDGLTLVVVGDTRPTLRAAVPDRRLGWVRRLDDVADSDLPALYTGAIGLVIPSLYEGFGLPLIEAMACGTPVVAARAGALPEVAGDAALLVDPCDPASVADGILRLVGDETTRQTCRTRGLDRAAAFDWDRSASMTWQVLADAAGGAA